MSIVRDSLVARSLIEKISAPHNILSICMADLAGLVLDILVTILKPDRVVRLICYDRMHRTDPLTRVVGSGNSCAVPLQTSARRHAGCSRLPPSGLIQSSICLRMCCLNP